MIHEIENATRRIICQLYNNGDSDKASMSALRSAYTIDGYRAQKVWPIFFGHLNEKWLSRNGKATWEETAIFAAVRMYALHQQASDYCVYERKDFSQEDRTATGGLEFFEALNRMKQKSESPEALDRRVQALLGTNNFISVVNQLIHLMQIIKSQKTEAKIDYALLAGNLYKFQLGYHQANGVRLHWGEQYYLNMKVRK